MDQNLETIHANENETRGSKRDLRDGWHLPLVDFFENDGWQKTPDLDGLDS